MAIHQQRELLQVTLASIGDGVITTDRDGNVTFLNPVAEHCTGWTLATAVGRPLATVFNIVNEETRRPVENPATRALREGVVVGLANHSVLIAEDGQERPIDDSAAPIRDANGVVAGVVLVFRDVTERRQHERELREALAEAEDITLRHPFLILDADLHVVGANRSFYERFKVLPEETIGRFVYDLGNRQWDIPRLRELLEEIVPQNVTFEEFEVEHDFERIGRCTLVLNARRVRRDGDQGTHILLAIEDVTDRRCAEAAIAVSERRYRRLFETAKDGILILDGGTGRITDVNPFMTELLSYPHEYFLGKELWEIGLFEDATTSREAFVRLQREEYIRYDHLPLRTAGGQAAEVEFISNLYSVDHKPIIQCNIRDITERHHLEEQERAHARALAEISSRKDEFLAMLGHELRNPLAPILNAVYLLARHGEEPPIQRQARDVIERQVAQLKRLVDDLLEVSRISTGRLELRRELITLSGVVEGAVQSTHSFIESRHHELTVSVPERPLWVYADAARLQQVLVNLVMNAAKYMDDGGHIWLTCEELDGEAVVRVRDTGPGIAHDLLPRVFDLFTQAERTLDRAQGGLGIGLAVVQRVMELHGGRVEVASVLGQGSEFVVRLSLAASPAPEQPAAPPAAVRPAFRSVRVLVVDDNVDAAESLALLLSLSGHEVRVAYTGPAALEVAMKDPPEMVLLDIGLPEMDGYEVAERIRKEPALAHTVLVAVTGYGQARDQLRAGAVGFNHYLVKPVDPDQLEQLVDTVARAGGVI
jgi:PAS domain S-box-containing protein